MILAWFQKCQEYVDMAIANKLVFYELRKDKQKVFLMHSHNMNAAQVRSWDLRYTIHEYRIF